jgi:hypothetical protein
MRLNLVIALALSFCLMLPRTSFAWVEEINQPEQNYDQSITYDDFQEFPTNTDNYDEDYSPPPSPIVRHKSHEIQTYDSSSSSMPSQIASAGEKILVIDPRLHSWGAYSSQGKLIRSGRATSGAKWCDDIGRPCRTKTGVFKINSLGSRDCISNSYPVDQGGGAPMPYCMFFNGGQAIHGSHQVVKANVSHGCVRVGVQDAQWIRYDFAKLGTKVVVKSY